MQVQEHAAAGLEPLLGEETAGALAQRCSGALTGTAGWQIDDPGHISCMSLAQPLQPKQLVLAVAGAVNCLCISIGHRLGLYKALATIGSGTSADLAQAAGGLSERFVREWCYQQAAGLLVTHAVLITQLPCHTLTAGAEREMQQSAVTDDLISCPHYLHVSYVVVPRTSASDLRFK